MEKKIMRDLFERQLQNLYNSELLILNILPEMLKYATDKELKEIIRRYTEQTYDQKQRLVEIGEYLHIRFKINDGKIILGLLEETRDLFADFPGGFLMDVGIISKIQHIGHFQISAYETALLYAKALDIKEVADQLDETLWEAYEGDENCGDYARNLIFNKN
ncbi:DUF892 family protein [Pricia sp. S334]|uniref:DUF892 family protein n=1 Tax=Pricia mediterranea TaxID=3076079 RepID=A0ABU3L1H5_9FLAO|nr:DUF892 family protein [Pricia sp. S334]MDT7827579.1 DUF892 family protein [Pricia sp. S334]